MPKRILPGLILLLLLVSGCQAVPVETAPVETPPIETPQAALARLQSGNQDFVQAQQNSADIASARRQQTAVAGQDPYAVVLTCADSRVPPEHIFNAGLGELFVIRTAGQVVGDYELGSIEYGVEHLGAPLILVLGHSGCGAVAAALEADSHAEGALASLIAEVRQAVADSGDSISAERANIRQSTAKILASEVVLGLLQDEAILLVEAKYDLASGAVAFYLDEQSWLE